MLTKLSEQLKAKALHQRVLFEQTAKTRSAEADIGIGIYVDQGKTYWCCPGDWFEEDNQIGGLVIDFANETGADVRLVETVRSRRTNSYHENFILGVRFGLFSTTNQNRSKAKKDFELGRTCMFSLIVKHQFIESKELGQVALKKDNFFFGNNPKEKNERKNEVVFFLKHELASYFENSKAGELLFAICTSTARKIGFTYILNLEEQDKIMRSAMTTFDDLLIDSYPVIERKVGKKVIEERRKPNIIKQSPLYTKEEMSLIHRCISPIFDDLVKLKENYYEQVYLQGFTALRNNVVRLIHKRVETLQRFSNRTKTRLQEIRRISKENEKKRKKDVAPTDVLAYLQKHDNPVYNLATEVKHMLGRNDWENILAIAFGMVPADGNIDKRLLFECFEVYRKMNLDSQKFKALTPIRYSEALIEKNYIRCMENLIKFSNCLGTTKSTLSGIQNINNVKLIGRIEKLSELYQSMSRLHGDVLTMDNSEVNVALAMMDFDNLSTTESLTTQFNSIKNRIQLEVARLRQVFLRKKLPEEVAILNKLNRLQTQVGDYISDQLE
jgi:hypothetical protein